MCRNVFEIVDFFRKDLASSDEGDEGLDLIDVVNKQQPDTDTRPGPDHPQQQTVG